MATAITKETLLPLGMIAGLVAVAITVGAQNQKLEQAVTDVAVMKPAIIEAQRDIAVIKASLVAPSSSVSNPSPPPSPAWLSSAPAGWSVGPDGHPVKL